MAVVSSDHADESMNMAAALAPSTQALHPRMITPAEVSEQQHWCCIDGWVVDITAFLGKHPGGNRKLLSADKASVGATGSEFGFSFTRWGDI